MNQDILKLINMRDVETEEIEWLWYPYIPFGKITIIQGDPGDGKTTMILAIASAITRGLPLPESDSRNEPINVIYQTAEDGLGDTIKPRLVQAGADCEKIMVIDESSQPLSLCDSRIEQAITQTNARLFILDPLQAYLGASVDMYRANEVRPLFTKLGKVAEKTGCAFVIVGHVNKGGSKSQYRGLGSIDIRAAARSVLTVGRVRSVGGDDKPYLRAFVHDKSNLAPEGVSIAFELDPDNGFKWIGEFPITLDELLEGRAVEHDGVFDKAVTFLKTELAERQLPASKVYELAAAQGISERTLKKAKSSLGVKSIRKENKWYWEMCA